MICEKCHYDNETGARFCANCGEPIPSRPGAGSVTSAGATYCPRCGSQNSPNSSFCESCGTLLTQTEPVTVVPAATKNVSGAWWLLPIFLTWVGGLIAYLVVRETDKSKAVKLLWTGIGMTIFWIILSIISMAASFFLADL